MGRGGKAFRDFPGERGDLIGPTLKSGIVHQAVDRRVDAERAFRQVMTDRSQPAVRRAHAKHLLGLLAQDCGHIESSTDYAAPPSSPIGVQSETIVTLAVTDDDTMESRETVKMTLEGETTSPATYITLTPAGIATAEIADNDYVIREAQITFDSQGVRSDTGSQLAYPGPQWLDTDNDKKDENGVDAADVTATPDNGFPLSYARSTPFIPGEAEVVAAPGVPGKAAVPSTPAVTNTITASPRFVIEYMDSSVLAGSFRIEGTNSGLGGGVFAGAAGKTSVFNSTTKTYLSGTFDSTENIDELIHKGELTVKWDVKRAVSVGGTTKEWVKEYATTKNRIYVTGAPVADAFHTVLDIACQGADGKRPRNPGETSSDNPLDLHDPDARDREVVDGVWSMFTLNATTRIKGTEMDRQNGTVMKYNHQIGTGYDVDGMLAQADGRGQCTAWTDLFIHALSVHNEASTTLYIATNNRIANFLFTVKVGPAQGELNPFGTTRTNSFRFHAIVSVAAYPGRLYDPSYGGTPVDETAGPVAHSALSNYEDKSINEVKIGFRPWRVQTQNVEDMIIGAPGTFDFN